jgi:hypothetical protein
MGNENGRMQNSDMSLMNKGATSGGDNFGSNDQVF